MLERRITGDTAVHHLLDRPRDAPGRTAAGAALFAFVSVIFVAGSADRIFVSLGISYARQVWLFRIAALAVPLAVFLVVRSVARELRDNDWHPFREPDTQVVRRTERGGFR
jgi:ubiquinol-cytochrome c reductase cytochrome b subunit